MPFNLTVLGVQRVMPDILEPWMHGLVAQWPMMIIIGDLTTPGRGMHLLSQVAHESDGGRVFEENLNYSARRLMEVWPGRFPTLASTTGYAGNPFALANKVYANRMGNGPPRTGDGFRYRGMGPIQLTGKDNRRAISAILQEFGVNVDLVHDSALLLDPKIGWLSAAAYWRMRRVNKAADLDDLDAAVKAVTLLVNGGTHGLRERTKLFKRARAVWKEQQPVTEFV